EGEGWGQLGGRVGRQRDLLEPASVPERRRSTLPANLADTGRAFEQSLPVAVERRRQRRDHAHAGDRDNGLAHPPDPAGFGASEKPAVLVSTSNSWRWLAGASRSASGITRPSNSAPTRRFPPPLPLPP